MRHANRVAKMVGGAVASAAVVVGLGAWACPASAVEGWTPTQGDPAIEAAGTVAAEGDLAGYGGTATNGLVAQAGTIASGTWGTCPWVVDANGKLTVGAGQGADTGGNCPWGDWDVYTAITSATFDEGVVLPAK